MCYAVHILIIGYTNRKYPSTTKFDQLHLDFPATHSTFWPKILISHVNGFSFTVRKLEQFDLQRACLIKQKDRK